jgi:hypothetical protein
MALQAEWMLIEETRHDNPRHRDGRTGFHRTARRARRNRAYTRAKYSYDLAALGRREPSDPPCLDTATGYTANILAFYVLDIWIFGANILALLNEPRTTSQSS